MSKRIDQKAAARAVREQLAKEQRRKRTIITSAVAAGVLVIAGMIGWALVASHKQSVVNTPANTNAAGVALVTGSGPGTVEDYVDFICPYCKQFHDEAQSTIAQLVAEKKITYVMHPVAFLDRASTNQYSTRATAASGCAADAGKAMEYSDVLFANQPKEGTAGPTDEQLIAFGTQVGLGDTFSRCVKDKRYVTWAKKVSDEASKAGVSSTPTVLVNGKKVQANSAAILAALGETSAAPTPSAS